MKKSSIILALSTALTFSACDSFLDQESQNILTEQQVYSDDNMVLSVLANYYGRISWGQHLGDVASMAILDEAGFSSGGPNNRQNYEDNLWRVYDYGLIRDLNMFINGIKTSTLSAASKDNYEGEARFIRAWVYFNMARTLGGVPLIGDQVFDYSSGTLAADLQHPRSTEKQVYDYIISECTEISEKLKPNKTTNSSRANKWTALSLKARAALYAASIAKYNYKTPDVITPGGEVGIPSTEANTYYNTALETANEVINNGPYLLYQKNADKGRNFYEAVSLKGSEEVIWARDYKYPGQTHMFTNNTIASSVRGDIDANIVTPILNLVESFEYKNNRNGDLKLTANGDYIYYDNPSDIFADKDPRLYGTVIYSGADFAGSTIVYQAGVRYFEDGQWKVKTAAPGANEAPYGLVTSVDGPTTSNDQFVNKTGFNLRKFVEENRDASTRGRGSDMWFVRFRLAELYLISAEASLELNKAQTEVASYINAIRNRAGIQPLTQVTLNDIIQERRVELAFEDHRYWDLKRWRIAHEVWDGQNSNPKAVHYVLFPYKVYAPGTDKHNKWVFEKRVASHTMNPRYFRYQNYYNFIDQNWLNSNPKLVRNPYQ
ncbi:RagB/SusD family nutrient uptake outer membrane protein [Sphingobacterium composti Ten et al. 2007 non Yoo et al. 2007]|uniref:RagB/SusD family nutrient uptake outer membrane protein n=1 Tax=Sphingobacterium composti TaxID=363260 RepID=UPI0013575D0D|nr:RagB/SusD family nutrient uptake outer membrane protein [Sphingobacterium composti Ten et al. 2007 non Yoo et al. 2007]